MRFFGKRSRCKSGVGSIVGAVFVLLIILSGFTFYSLYMSTMDHYNQTMGSMGDFDWNRGREKLVIKQVRITGGSQLNVTVENQGTLPCHLVWFGLFNKTAVPESQGYYALDMSIDPSEVQNVVSSFTIVMGKKYVIQLVTELGNRFESKFYPASEVRCALSLTVTPPTVYVGNNITVMLVVTQNDTDVDVIQSLTASLSATPGGLVQLMASSPLAVDVLAEGQNAFFWWIYSAIATGTVTFNASYGQAPAGIYVLSTANILTTPAGGAGSVAITGVNCTAAYNPSVSNLLGSTTHVSGSISDLASNDSSYAVYRSYATESTDIHDFVDNATSDEDGFPDKGTHSNFTAEQYGPDSIYDALTEQKTTTGFLVKKGAFAKSTTTGSQTVTGIGFVPKAVIFWWTRQTSYGELAGVLVGYGFATNFSGSYQNRGVAFASNDGAASSAAGRRRSETYSIIILASGTPTLGAQASVTSFNSDGFVLNWQTNEARADIIHYVALGGTDLSGANAGTFGLTASTGPQDVTGVGFQPEFAMFLWTFTEAVDTNTAHAEIGLGFARSSTKRGALVANSENGRGTMDTWQQQRIDSCILLLDPTTGSQDAIVDFSQFLADGFRVTKSDAPAASTPVFYLTLKGGEFDVGSVSSPTVTGNQDITGVGFQPKLLMLATQGRAASTAVGATAEMTFGASTSATDRGATWFEDTDALADSDNEMETLGTKVVQWRDETAANVFTLRGSADFASFLSDGFRLSWSNVETTARQIIYVAFGGRNYELDLEAQWNSANCTQTNEYLCIRTGTLGAEALNVDVWTGGSWVNIITGLVADSWNNVSVSSFLASSVFTIRFKDGAPSGDITPDSWNIDVVLLHVWGNNEYGAEVEFTGLSDLKSWTSCCGKFRVVGT